MPGVSITIKGTLVGGITNLDGIFSIPVEEKYLKSKNITVVISYLGYDSIELTLTPGSSQNATLTSYSPMLEEVVVMSYGNAPKNEPAPKSVNKEAYSGEVITKKEDQLIDREAERALYQQLMSLDRLRTNFSDVGFWVPNLYTDKKGKATFKVMFPDNLTRWDAVVYAMNPQLQTGTHRTSIHSYKPLMAEMIQPAFMIEGDTAYIETYVRDYTGEDSRSGNLRLETNGTVLSDETINFRTTHQGTRAIYAIQDTLHTRLTYTDEDGYRDGEEKRIPILKQGVQATFETIRLLMEGDTLPLQLPEEGIATLRLFTQTLNIHKNLAGYLSGYEYACNEQLASKLTGLLVHKEIADLQGEPFLYDKNIDEIINRLVNNQNSVNMWGWWNRVMPEYSLVWMTHHILNALRIAQQSGYTSAGKVRFATQPPARIASQASLQDSILLLQSGTLVSQPDSLQKQIEQLEAGVHRLADAGKPYIRENY
ncbi:MAG: carboxypeptidase-like regulatory domain-containing protein [Tannerellaceae bacterium]|nr:carboxypeptidase-like regulatory domain-containing protein [Tannerellaceae bacterium]